MLTKEDLTQIKEIVDGSISNAFRDFYDSIFEPYVNKNEAEHAEMKQEIVGIKQEVAGMKKEVGDIKEFIKDHEHRLKRVESCPPLKN